VTKTEQRRLARVQKERERLGLDKEQVKDKEAILSEVPDDSALDAWIAQCRWVMEMEPAEEAE
jgi:hypothetical protein